MQLMPEILIEGERGVMMIVVLVVVVAAGVLVDHPVDLQQSKH
jgi:hypothetical protein